MRAKALLLAVLALGLLLSGCAALREYADIARPRDLSRDYRTALAEWTREQTVYSEFATRAKMAATFRSREFVKAYLAEYERLYLLNESPDTTAHPALEAAGKVAELILYVYVPDREAIDLDRSDSSWKAFLLSAAGERYEPMEIRELRDVGPLVREFYPYINPEYGKVYLLKFDAALAEGETTELPVSLVVTGVIARVELVWN